MGNTGRKSLFWAIGILVGVVLIVIGVGAGYVDVATHFRFDFLSNHFGWFILALLVGCPGDVVTI
jgi:hypothetical protein